MNLQFCPVVLDKFIGMEGVGADLAAPGDFLLRLVQLVHLLFLFPLLQLVDPGLENGHGDRLVLVLHPLVLARPRGPSADG